MFLNRIDISLALQIAKNYTDILIVQKVMPKNLLCLPCMHSSGKLIINCGDITVVTCKRLCVANEEISFPTAHTLTIKTFKDA